MTKKILVFFFTLVGLSTIQAMELTIPLHYVKAAEAATIVKPGMTFTVDIINNALIVRGTREQVLQIQYFIINVIDVAPVTPMPPMQLY